MPGDDRREPQATTTSRFETPDGGGLITLTANGYNLDDPWSTQVTLTARDPGRVLALSHEVRGFDIEFTGNYDFVIADVLRGTVTDRLSSQGGEILIARGDEQALALWRGPHHEAAIWLSDPKMPTATILTYFDGISFTDTPTGLLVKSHNAELEDVATLEVIKYIPGVGFLDIKTAEAAADMIPTWAGAAVPAGELWRLVEEATPGQPARSVFILANTTAVAVISGEEADEIEGPRIEFIDRLVALTWTKS